MSQQEEFSSFDGVHQSPINNTLADWIERPFEEDEIKKAAFECDGNKSLGPDGFTMAVFQHQWDIVKNDLFEMLQEFH